MSDTCQSMHGCLFFTAQALCRTLTRIAEEELAPTGLAPSQTYLLMLVIDCPGISQKELGENMQLAPSTITRFVDSFIRKGLVTKKSEGKLVRVSATERGLALEATIKQVWARMHERYSAALGEEERNDLAIRLDQTVKALEAESTT